MVDPMLQFFQLRSGHNALELRFEIMADHIIDALPRNPERTVALRKLLEAKDCAVRASIFKSE